MEPIFLTSHFTLSMLYNYAWDSDKDISQQDISDAIQSLGGPVTRTRARKINRALVQFMINSMEDEDLVEEKKPKLVFIIQEHYNGVKMRHSTYF